MKNEKPPAWTVPFDAVKEGGRWIVPVTDEKAARTVLDVLMIRNPGFLFYAAQHAGSKYWFVGCEGDRPKRRKDDA